MPSGPLASSAAHAVEKQQRALAGLIGVVFLAGLVAVLGAEPTNDEFGFGLPHSSSLAAPLALLAAISWGAADYVAGTAARKSSALRIVVGSHMVGMVALTALSPLIESSADLSDLVWGASGGMGGGLGTLLLYRGLAVGRMGVVAPVTAALAAAVPVLVGLLGGDVIGNLGLLGIGLAFPAVLLVAMAPEDQGPVGTANSFGTWIHQPGLVYALIGGLGFGLFYVCLDRTGGDTGVWPLLAARVASVAMLGAAAIAAERRLLPSVEVRGATVLAGVLDVTAAVLFLLATRQGALAIASILTSMYPATTVLLAVVLLRERCSTPQLVGMALSGVAISFLVLS